MGKNIDQWYSSLSDLFYGTDFQVVKNAEKKNTLNESIHIHKIDHQKPQLFEIWPQLYKTNVIISTGVNDLISKIVKLPDNPKIKGNKIFFYDVSDDLILQICKVFIEEYKKLSSVDPTFSLYKKNITKKEFSESRSKSSMISHNSSLEPYNFISVEESLKNAVDESNEINSNVTYELYNGRFNSTINNLALNDQINGYFKYFGLVKFWNSSTEDEKRILEEINHDFYIIDDTDDDNEDEDTDAEEEDEDSTDSVNGINNIDMKQWCEENGMKYLTVEEEVEREIQEEERKDYVPEIPEPDGTFFEGDINWSNYSKLEFLDKILKALVY